MFDSSVHPGLERVVAQTAYDAQCLIGMMSADDAGASLSFHEGKPSPLAVEIQRWATVNARYKHGQQKMLAALEGPLVIARSMLGAEDLRDCLTDDIMALNRCCRFSFGQFEFGLDFGQMRVMARHGAVREFMVSRRFLLEEIPCLTSIAPVLCELARAHRHVRR